MIYFPLIEFRDRNPHVINALKSVFDGDRFSFHCGDFFGSNTDFDCVVSPANSFGIMSGGLDLVIRNYFGMEIEKKTQSVILNDYFGEMIVGEAEIILTDHPKIPFMVCAPTMRLPMNVADTINAYYAFRATLIALYSWNHLGIFGLSDPIKKVACSGLATLAGGMDPVRMADQMKYAYSEVLAHLISRKT